MQRILFLTGRLAEPALRAMLERLALALLYLGLPGWLLLHAGW